jgi:hypothetical protein
MIFFKREGEEQSDIWKAAQSQMMHGLHLRSFPAHLGIGISQAVSKHCNAFKYDVLDPTIRRIDLGIIFICAEDFDLTQMPPIIFRT